MNTARFYQAAYAVRDPATGQIVCGPTATNPYFLAKSAPARATLNANLGAGACVPLNPFGPNQNQAATSYIRANIKQWVVTKQIVGAAAVSGCPSPPGPVRSAWRSAANGGVSC